MPDLRHSNLPVVRIYLRGVERPDSDGLTAIINLPDWLLFLRKPEKDVAKKTRNQLLAVYKGKFLLTALNIT